MEITDNTIRRLRALDDRLIGLDAEFIRSQIVKFFDDADNAQFLRIKLNFNSLFLDVVFGGGFPAQYDAYIHSKLVDKLIRRLLRKRI